MGELPKFPTMKLQLLLFLSGFFAFSLAQGPIGPILPPFNNDLVVPFEELFNQFLQPTSLVASLDNAEALCSAGAMRKKKAKKAKKASKGSKGKASAKSKKSKKNKKKPVAPKPPPPFPTFEQLISADDGLNCIAEVLGYSFNYTMDYSQMINDLSTLGPLFTYVDMERVACLGVSTMPGLQSLVPERCLPLYTPDEITALLGSLQVGLEMDCVLSALYQSPALADYARALILAIP